MFRNLRASIARKTGNLNQSLRIGKLFGIPIHLHFSWLIIFVYLTVILSAGLFPTSHIAAKVTGGIITSLLFFASVIAHELSHSGVATKVGVPVKSITLYIFGGIAQITREASRPRDELKMALAGPACSFILACFFGLIWFVLPSNFYTFLSAPVSWLATMNLMLALFNLIPGFPLDGGRVLRALLWHGTKNYKRSTYIAAWMGRGIGYLFIIVGVTAMFLHQMKGAPYFAELLGLHGGLWLAFVGWLLALIAGTSYRQAEIHYNLQAATVAEAMITTHPSSPSSSLNLRQVVQDYAQLTPRPYLPVLDEGKLKGVVTLPSILAVPQQDWESVRVAEVMTSMDKLTVAHPRDTVLEVLEQMEKHNLTQLLVAEGGTIIGIITRDSLRRFIQNHIQRVK